MSRRSVVRVDPSFIDDLPAQLAVLQREGRVDRIVRLREDLRDARDLLRRFPHVGTIEIEDEHGALRRLILRHVPYVIWFVSEARRRTRVEVTLVRLFHARQARPTL